MQKINLSNNKLISNKSSKSPSYFCPQLPLFFEKTVVDELIIKGQSKNKNVRICLHSNKNEEMQEMLIYQTQEKFYPPKKHLKKEKSFHIIRGKLVICVFNNSGDIISHIILHPDLNLYCRIPKNTFHIDFPVGESVHLETTVGPFEEEDTIFPGWYNESDRFLLENKILKLIS